MKLLLSDEGIEQITWDNWGKQEKLDIKPRTITGQAIAQAQLDKIFNLDAKTTVEVINKLRKRLDNLLEKELQ